jgi:hypothetical protein
VDLKTLVRLCAESVRLARPLLASAGRVDQLDWVKPPRPQASFGLVGDWVHVPRIGSAFAMLFVPFEPDRLGWVDARTLRLFALDPSTKRLTRASRTGRHAKLPVFHVALDRPATVGLIGMSQHPLVREAIRQLCAAAGVIRSLPQDMRGPHRDRICEVSLCSPEMVRLADSPRALRDFAEGLGQKLPPDPLPPPLSHEARPGETLCDRCHGIDVLDFPECSLLDEPLADRPCQLARWESVGPDHISGAMREVVVDPTNRRRLYAVAANGGVWRLDNVDDYPETTWRPLTDGLPSLRFRTMAVAPSRGRVLYAANSVKELSAAPIRVFSELHRSLDRGLTWQAIHGAGMGVMHRIVVHPANPDVVLVALSTGLWRQAAAGGGWANLFPDDCLDVALDPDDSSIVYLGVRGRGVFKSFTFGSDWPADPLLPFDAAAAGGRGLIQLALGRRNAGGTPQTPVLRTVVARFGNEICVSDTSGEGPNAWRRTVPVIMQNNPQPPPAQIDAAPNLLNGGTSNRSDTNPRVGSEWCNCLAVDPFDPAHILTGSQSLIESRDGGATWAARSSAHEDEQHLAFDPDTPGLVYLANDGGLFSSINGGANWATMSLAHVTPADGRGLNLARGLVTSELRQTVVRLARAVTAIDHSGFVLSDDFDNRWQFLFNGPDSSARHIHERSFVFPCPADENRYYVLNMRDDDDPTGVTQRIAQMDFTRTNGLVDPPSFTFLSALRASLPDVGTYFPELQVYRRHLPGPFAARFSSASGERLLLFGAGAGPGGPFTIQSLRLAASGTNVLQEVQEITSAEPFFALAFVPTDPDRAFAITSSGELFERDFSTAGPFTSVARWAFPATDPFASRLVPVSRPGLAVYALSQSAIGRFDDEARTWTTVHTWPQPDEGLLSLAAHTMRDATLFLGTSRGVYLSENGGGSWSPYMLGLPHVPVTELTFDGGFLYAATLGRGLWRCRPCGR